MAGLLVVFFPFVLLAFMILMERVEDPLRTVAVGDRVEQFLAAARPDEMHTSVRVGFPAAYKQSGRRRRLSRLLTRRPRAKARPVASPPPPAEAARRPSPPAA